MSGSDYWGPTAGAHHPPDTAYNPAARGNEHAQNTHSQYQPEAKSAQYQSYDPNPGYPTDYVPPRNPPPSNYDPQHFPPPPRSEYQDTNYRSPPPPSEAPRSAYGGRGPSEYTPRSNYDPDRPYAPADPRPNDGNALTPYDEEKAEARWREDYEDGQRRGYGRPPPPRSEYTDRYSDDRTFDERDRAYPYDPRYDPRDRRYDPTPPRAAASPDSYYDYRDSNDRRDSRQTHRASPKGNSMRDIFRAHEGDRGIGAQVLGGAAGALAGHELGHSLLDTIGGAIVGAVGARVLEKQIDKRKLRKEDERTGTAAPPSIRDGSYDDRGSRYPPSSRATTRAPLTSRSRSVVRSPSRSRGSPSPSRTSVPPRSRSRRSPSRTSRLPRSRSRSWDSDDRSSMRTRR